MVTVHSTGGLEYAAHGKPILVADRGWYDQAGFSVNATTRTDYIDRLRKEWWQDIDVAAARRRALIFAGAYFCAPAWQSSLLMVDDSSQDAAWEHLVKMLDRTERVKDEIDTICAWFQSDSPRYHSYKVAAASELCLGNAGG
jgi:hypothetical protein